MPRAKLLNGLGLLVGMVVGAGMFAIPHTIASAGYSAFLGLLVIVIAAITAVHLLYGDIYYRHYEHHRLPGLIHEHLGATAYRISLVARFFAYFGTQLAYGVLGGIFLSYVVPWFGQFALSMMFFIAFIPVLGRTVRKAGSFNLWLTIPLAAFVVLLFILLAPNIKMPEGISFGLADNWFLPYGVLLFSFGGASVIPEVVDVFSGKDRRLFRITVFLAALAVAIIYAFFAVSVLGVAGAGVSDDALLSLRGVVGGVVFRLSAIIGLLAVATSYLAMGLELRYTLQYDARQNKRRALVLTAFIPIILFVAGFTNYLSTIAVVGAVGVGIEGLFIMLLARRVLKTNALLVSLLAALFAAGAALGVLDSLGII